jgi:hypothetical protein
LDENGFREFLKDSRKVPKVLSENAIRSQIRIVKEFESYLEKRGKNKQSAKASERDLRGFISCLFSERRVNPKELIGLLRYARFSGNNDAVVPLLETLNSDQLSSFCTSFGEEYGKGTKNRILGGFEPPPIGTPAKRIPDSTNEFLNRLESGIGEEATGEFLKKHCPDAGPPESYSEEKDLFLASKDVDEFLRKLRSTFLKELEGYLRDGTLYYTQKIDRDVIDFVRGNPEIGSGVRRGALIYHTKIPYMAIEYLREKDPKKKRYYCCHCPLARESILSGRTVSPNLCHCSAGYCKRPFEMAFGEPLKAKVTKSVLRGDSVCQFAIEIPKRLILRMR